MVMYSQLHLYIPLRVLNTYLFIFVSQVHFCLCLFHIFSRMEKNSWEMQERRMKEQYLIAIADKDQQLSHLQSLVRELRSSSQTETHRAQYQRQVSNSSTDRCLEETSASCKLSAHLPLLGKPSDDFLRGGQGFWREGFKYAQC